MENETKEGSIGLGLTIWKIKQESKTLVHWNEQLKIVPDDDHDD